MPRCKMIKAAQRRSPSRSPRKSGFRERDRSRFYVRRFVQSCHRSGRFEFDALHNRSDNLDVLPEKTIAPVLRDGFEPPRTAEMPSSANDQSGVQVGSSKLITEESRRRNSGTRIVRWDVSHQSQSAWTLSLDCAASCPAPFLTS